MSTGNNMIDSTLHDNFYYLINGIDPEPEYDPVYDKEYEPEED